MKLGRRSFLIGSAGAAIAGIIPKIAAKPTKPTSMSPGGGSYVFSNVNSVRLPGAFTGAQFFITNNSDMPLTIYGGPSEMVVKPKETRALIKGQIKFHSM